MENETIPTRLDGISVVVTCFNLEKFIGATLASVREQQNAGTYEVIVVDDCSTDGSAEIIQSFPGVRYFRTPSNGGVLRAMLAGVNEAQFDIIALLDGDDIWEPNKLRRLRKSFEQDPLTAFITHDLKFIDGKDGIVERVSLPKKVIGAVPIAEQGEKVRRGILDHADYVWLGSAISFRQNLSAFHEFTKFCANLPDPTNCYQDWPLAYWIAARPNVNLAYIDAPLFRYRLHAANHSGDSRTPERALRNFNRTKNTLDAIVKIAHHSCVDAQSRKIVEERLTFIKAQVNLYSGRRTAAILGFFRSIPLLARTREIGKELVRFALGVTLGPVALTRLVARRKSKSFPDAVFVERSDRIEPQ